MLDTHSEWKMASLCKRLGQWVLTRQCSPLPRGLPVRGPEGRLAVLCLARLKHLRAQASFTPQGQTPSFLGCPR